MKALSTTEVVPCLMAFFIGWAQMSSHIYAVRSWRVVAPKPLHSSNDRREITTMTLQDFFRENPKVAVAFSGGVDSSYLLYAAKHYGAEVKSYFVKSQFQPEFELEDAQKLAEQLGVELTVLRRNALDSDLVRANDPLRCYYCKSSNFGLIQEQALADGYPVLVDGTNASDDEGDRPGMKALEELSVRSPLRESGITKAEIRRLSKEAGLFTWDKPSYACLATRIPTGTAYTYEALAKVESAEKVLFELGFSDFRVRIFNGAARLQLPLDQFDKAMALREDILKRLSSEFAAVLLDLMPRA